MPPMAAILRIGTRGSPLALAQAREAAAALARAHAALAGPGAVEIVPIRTSGDRLQDRPLADIGGKALFTKEIEEALAAGAVDAAVHSMKDMPTRLPPGLAIACVLEREDPRDAVFTRAPLTGGLCGLAPGTVVGTSSPRRRAILLHRRPDLEVRPLRGNVDTRLARLGTGAVDATILAVAGLRRLGEAGRIGTVLEPEEMLPAPAQGAIAVEAREGDERVLTLLAALHHVESGQRVAAERALLAVIDGTCRTPVAALARIGPDGRLRLDGLLLTPDGTAALAAAADGPPADAEAIGAEVGRSLRSRADASFGLP
jgi:hydroxymethylbilane synthase